MHHCHELHRHVTTTSRHCCNSFPSDKQASMGKGDDNLLRVLDQAPDRPASSRSGAISCGFTHLRIPVCIFTGTLRYNIQIILQDRKSVV